MRILKIALIALLVVVSILFCVTTANRYLSGSHIPPTIQCASDTLEVSVLEDESAYLAGVTASDKQDGDLTGRILIQGISKLITNDTAKVSYIVFDRDGNAATASRMVRYTDYERPTFTVNQPLVYTENQDIRLLDRVNAKDCMDGDITQSIRVSSMAATADPEVQTVTVQVTNSMGDTAQQLLPLVVYSGTVVRPDVLLTDYLIYLEQGDSFDPSRYLVSVNTPIGPGNTGDVQITGSVDTSVPGTYFVYYRYPYSITVGLTVLTVVVE